MILSYCLTFSMHCAYAPNSSFTRAHILPIFILSSNFFQIITINDDDVLKMRTGLFFHFFLILFPHSHFTKMDWSFSASLAPGAQMNKICVKLNVYICKARARKILSQIIDKVFNLKKILFLIFPESFKSNLHLFWNAFFLISLGERC